MEKQEKGRTETCVIPFRKWGFLWEGTDRDADELLLLYRNFETAAKLDTFPSPQTKLNAMLELIFFVLTHGNFQKLDQNTAPGENPSSKQ